MKLVTNFSNGTESVNELTLSQEASTLVAQYKNIIREQDSKIQGLNEKFKALQQQNESLTVSEKFANASSTISAKIVNFRRSSWRQIYR